MVAQSRMFRTFIENNAKRIAGENVKRILDIGCGEGQLTQVFAKLYPDAHVIGFDKDEKAIETAQRSAHSLKNLEFVVGDGAQSLPPGPFDLIYESLCFVHIPAYPKIIENVYKVLAPGGLLWSKEMDEKVGNAVDMPGYIEIWKTVQSAMGKIGNDIFMKGLPDALKTSGFSDVHVEEELLPMGNLGIDGRIMMAIGLGVMYNARKMISKINQVPESDLENLYKNTIEAMMAPGAPTGHVPFRNTIARRPEVELKPAAPADVSSPGAAMTDIENPYILSDSGEVDRARLVAQTRLFRGYIERNAKQFVGENIKSILDFGCGEGQLTQVFAHLYPDAQVLGIDKDEKAIEAAQRAARSLPNLRFELRDIAQGLPAGPFDLVYESMVLLHLPGTPKLIKAIYDVLKPGGYLWAKGLDNGILTGVNDPAYMRMCTWLANAMEKVNQPWNIASNLAPILTAAGFNVLRSESESYPIGNMSAEARITMAVNLGAIYNARPIINRMLQVPLPEIEHTYKELVATMMAPGGPRGVFSYVNNVARRPVESVTLPPPVTAS